MNIALHHNPVPQAHVMSPWLIDNGFINQVEELALKAPEISFYDWQQHFATNEACMEHLAQLRWPGGFQCPKYGHDHGYYTAYREHYECTACA